MDLAHELLDLGVERRPAEDDFLKASAERVNHGVAYLLEDELVQDRYAHECLVAVHHGLYLALVEFLDDERHGDDDIRMNLRERLHDHLRARCAGEEVHMRTDGHLEEELEHHAVHVRRRQHGHHFGLAAHLRLGDIGGEPYVAPERPVRDHHALGEAGGPGGIVDESKFIRLVLHIAYILRSEASGYSF